MRNLTFKKNRKNTVEALMGGHPLGVKKVSITAAGRLWKCKDAEFVWEKRKTGSHDSGCK